MTWMISDIQAGKLASIAVHAEDYVSGRDATAVNALQIAALVASPEVQEFLHEVGPLAPRPRVGQ